jgi:SAM-dependent methyltransferase
MKTSSAYEEQPFVAEYYHLLSTYVGRPDLEFYLEHARAANGKVLELGCGTGRILIPTAAAGHPIVGLDISEHMLAKCRENLEAQPPEVQQRVRLVQGDMTAFDLGERVGLVTAPFHTFQHLLSVGAQLACLRCINRHLVTGGKLILDLVNVHPRRTYDPAYLQETPTLELDLPDGRKLRLANRFAAYHRAEQINETEVIHYITYPDGRTERLVQASPYRYFYRYEVEHLLARCGFAVAALYGKFDQSPYDDDSPQMIFVGEKTEDSGR